MESQSSAGTITLAQIDETRDAILAKLPRRMEGRLRIGLILGSGLGALAEVVDDAVVIPYQDLSHWPTSTVAGHQGALVIGFLEGKPILVMKSRAHFYEGYSMQQVTLPVRVMQRLGVEILIVTNAAGAVNQEYSPGDLMLILDHLNLVGMAGNSPLRGPNLDLLGPRFPDMSQA